MNSLISAKARALALTLPVAALGGGAVLLHPTSAFGQSDEPTDVSRPDEPVELPGMDVYSSALPRSTEDMVHPVDVLGSKELKENRGGTIGDVLADRPGVYNSSFGPGVGRPVIRGQGGARVQVLENGIGSMDASTVSADHATTVDPFNADQVEIIKGPATLIYGSGASAGVVNVIDDRLPDSVTPGLRVDTGLTYGENGDEKVGAFKARYGTGPFQLGSQYSMRDADDFTIPGSAERPSPGQDEPSSSRLENSSVKTESWGGSAAWVGERGMLGGAISRFISNYGIPGHEHAHGGGAGGHSHDGVRIDMEQVRGDFRGLLDAPLPGFSQWETRFGINDYQHTEVEPGGGIHTLFQVKELDARTQLLHEPLAGWTGVLGLHAGDRDFSAQGAEADFAPPVHTQSLGLFVVEGYELGEHGIELGARIEKIEHNPDLPGLQDLDFTPTSLSAGVNYRLAEHLHLRVNGQRAQRAPAAEELYANGAHLATLSFERGNPSLEKETANTLDVRLERDVGRWAWALSGFYNRINDYVFLSEVDGNGDGAADRVDESGTLDPNGELLLVDYAQRDATLRGAELSLIYRLIQTGPFRLSVNALADTVRGRLAGGDNLPRMTPTRFGGGLTGSYGPFEGSLNYLRVEEQDRNAELETPTPGYDLLGARLSYRLTSGTTTTTYFLQGNNLLDEKIRLSTSLIKDVAPQPGRSLFAGVRIEFETP